MNTEDPASTPHPETAAEEAWESAKHTAADLEQRGEQCVRLHTPSAIATAFGGGLLLGLLLGWRIAESRHEDYLHAGLRHARNWRNRCSF